MAANAHGISLERGRLGVVLATIVINVVAVSLLAFAPWSDWRTGAALNIVDNCLLVGFALVRQDALLGRFLLFGLLVGFTELSADAWLVDYTRTLDYSIGGGPMIWRSPLWMPLAWEVVAVQFGYIGLRLWERFGKVGLRCEVREGLIEFLCRNHPESLPRQRSASEPLHEEMQHRQTSKSESIAQGKEHERGPKAPAFTLNQRVTAPAVSLAPREKGRRYSGIKSETFCV